MTMILTYPDSMLETILDEQGRSDVALQAPVDASARAVHVGFSGKYCQSLPDSVAV